jgi:hypothetical protein
MNILHILQMGYLRVLVILFLLPHAHLHSLRQQFATVCALYANNWLPCAQLMLANFYAQTTYTSKLLSHAQYLTNEKSSKSKAILTHSSGPQRNLLFFGANSKSKIVASVQCAYASKDKMIPIWPKYIKKNILCFSLQVYLLLCV